MNIEVKQLINLITKAGYPITTAANLANKKSLDSAATLNEANRTN